MIRSLIAERKDEIVERLAELEHEQWVEWSKSIASKLVELRDAASLPLVKNSFWVHYVKLNEKTKERDRVWVRKVLQIFKELNMEIVSR